MIAIDDTHEAYKIFREYSDCRMFFLRTIIKEQCPDCLINESGGKSVRSDLDVGVTKKITDTTTNLDATAQIDTYIPTQAIDDINDKFNRIIKKTIKVDPKYLNLSTNLANLLFDINIYGHTFYFRSPFPYSTHVDGIYYYDFYIVLDLEKKHNRQLIYSYLRLYQESINHKLIPPNYIKDIEELQSKINTTKDTTKQYLVELNNLDTMIKSLPQTNDKIEDIYAIINKISECDLYAFDSYCTYGAFMHVVVLLQKKITISLPKVVFKHSMIENFAKAFHYFDKNTPVLNILIKASKYLMRMYDAIHRLEESSKNITEKSGNITEKRDLFTYLSDNFRRKNNISEDDQNEIKIKLLSYGIDGIDGIDRVFQSIFKDYFEHNDDLS